MLKVDFMSGAPTLGFPKIRGSFLRVPMRRIIVFGVLWVLGFMVWG